MHWQLMKGRQKLQNWDQPVLESGVEAEEGPWIRAADLVLNEELHSLDGGDWTS
jgi:hypothetical protein